MMATPSASFPLGRCAHRCLLPLGPFMGLPLVVVGAAFLSGARTVTPQWIPLTLGGVGLSLGLPLCLCGSAVWLCWYEAPPHPSQPPSHRSSRAAAQRRSELAAEAESDARRAALLRRLQRWGPWRTARAAEAAAVVVVPALDGPLSSAAVDLIPRVVSDG